MRVRIASLFRSGFAPRTADGELAYSSPRAAETDDEAAFSPEARCPGMWTRRDKPYRD